MTIFLAKISRAKDLDRVVELKLNPVTWFFFKSPCSGQFLPTSAETHPKWWFSKSKGIPPKMALN